MFEQLGSPLGSARMPTGFADRKRILWDELLKNVMSDDLFVSVLLPL